VETHCNILVVAASQNGLDGNADRNTIMLRIVNGCVGMVDYFAVYNLFQIFLIRTANFETFLSSKNIVMFELLCNCLLIEKLIVPEIVKEFAKLFGTLWYFDVFTTV
jgi:hypothetical protein